MSSVVVTGGAGFLGSHLCRALLDRGDRVTAVDNLLTGSTGNLTEIVAHPQFRFVRHDVTSSFDVEGPVDAVLHFASPASPRDYLGHPLETLAAGSLGTLNTLALAAAHGARYLLASTSEVYGDPLVHPQREDYWGNVNPVGPRSVYDEAKRFGEAAAMSYHRVHGLDVGIARIFNTFGERMRPSDGRVVSTLLSQALAGAPLTVHGDGSQTRSFCYVEDEVRGLVALLDSDHVGPMNIGNPHEISVLELARAVVAVTGSSSEIVFEARSPDDPTRRRPDIGLARKVLGWEPEVELHDGLRRTARWLARG